MAELEQIYNDHKAWVYYGTDEGSVGVYARCECGRYLKHGQLLTNLAEEVKLTGWICSRCGEVQPLYDRDIQFENN